MSSVQNYIKQQNILYAPVQLSAGADISLNVYNLSTDNFTQVNVPLGTGSNVFVFRDMGDIKRSAGRQFRKVQLLLPGNPSTFGVVGSSTNTSSVNTYNTYWYENSIEYGNAWTNGLYRIQ